MNVFITGATGFLGKHLVRRLAGQPQYQIVCLARKTSDYKEAESLGARIVFGDVTDKASVRAGMEGCEVVLNLANLFTYWEPDPRDYYRINVEGTRNVMEAALELGVKKIVHVSSIAAYGKSPDKILREESPEVPATTAYGVSKQEGDRIIWQMYQERALPVVMVYPGAITGPGNTRVGNAYFRNYIAGKIPSRMIEKYEIGAVDVRDAAEIVVRAMEKEGNIGERYLAGNGRSSVGIMNRLLHQVTGIRPPRFTTPLSMVRLMASMLTWIANRTKRPPMWELSKDLVNAMIDTRLMEGSKAERELGIIYRDIDESMAEEIQWTWNEMKAQKSAAPKSGPVQAVK